MKAKSSYPILFDTYQYHHNPTEISKNNETLLSLLAVDRMIDNAHTDQDEIMNELYEVDMSVSNAPRKDPSVVINDNEESMIMELLYIDQLVDNQHTQNTLISLYNPYTKKEISCYDQNQQYFIDCTTISSSTFQSLLITDESIDKSKKEQQQYQNTYEDILLDLYHVDEEIDSHKKKNDPVYLIMEEIYSVDLEIANASSQNDKVVEDILHELLKVDEEIDYASKQSNPVTITTLDILFNDRLIDTSKNTKKVPKMLIDTKDKEDVIHYKYDTKVLKGYNYFLEEERKCDIEDGRNPLLLDLWDVDYEMSNLQLVNGDVYKAFQVIYNVDVWVDKQHQKHRPSAGTSKAVGLDKDVMDLLEVDNFIANYNQTKVIKDDESILYDLLRVDNEIGLHNEGTININRNTIHYPVLQYQPVDIVTLTPLDAKNDAIQALLNVDQEIDGCKKKSKEDEYYDILEELYNVDQEIEYSTSVKNNRDYAVKTHIRKEQEGLDGAQSKQKRSIFTGQEKQMAYMHANSSGLNDQGYDDYYGDHTPEKEKKHGLKKLKGKNVCVVM